MSGRANRRRGHDWEREVRNRLAYVWPDAVRGLQSQGLPSVPDVRAGPFSFECKCRRIVSMPKAMAQAEAHARASGLRPACAIKILDSRDQKKREYVLMHLDDFIDLARMAARWETTREMRPKED